MRIYEIYTGFETSSNTLGHIASDDVEKEQSKGITTNDKRDAYESFSYETLDGADLFGNIFVFNNREKIKQYFNDIKIEKIPIYNIKFPKMTPKFKGTYADNPIIVMMVPDGTYILLTGRNHLVKKLHGHVKTISVGVVHVPWESGGLKRGLQAYYYK